MMFPGNLQDVLRSNASAADMLSAIWDGSAGAPGSMEDLVMELGRKVMGARQEADTSQAAFKQAMAAPVQTISPLAESIVTSLGRAAAGLSGSDEPTTNAKNLIERENHNLLLKRQANLAALEDAYKRAADRAEKMGDLETEIKYKREMAAAQDKRELTQKLIIANLETEARSRLQRESDERQAAAGLELQKQRERGDMNVQRMRNEQDERNALIAQGLDPNGTGEPLLNSKAQRMIQARSKGFLDAAQWALAFNRLQDDAKKTGMLGATGYDLNKMRSKILNELPPEMSYAADPEQWTLRIADLRNPNNPKEYLFPHDKSGNVTPYWGKKIVEMAKQWYPNWVPGVAAVDSVGK